MIRFAAKADIPRLLEMGSDSLKTGPYRDQVEDNPEAASALAFSVIEGQKGRVLVAEENGRIHGLLAYILFPHYFSGVLTAGEVMLYVEPAAREKYPLDAIALMRAAERHAREAGAKRIQFTAPTQDVAALYEKMGYRPIEVSYQKVL